MGNDWRAALETAIAGQLATVTEFQFTAAAANLPDGRPTKWPAGIAVYENWKTESVQAIAGRMHTLGWAHFFVVVGAQDSRQDGAARLGPAGDYVLLQRVDEVLSGFFPALGNPDVAVIEPCQCTDEDPRLYEGQLTEWTSAWKVQLMRRGALNM